MTALLSIFSVSSGGGGGGGNSSSATAAAAAAAAAVTGEKRASTAEAIHMSNIYIYIYVFMCLFMDIILYKCSKIHSVSRRGTTMYIPDHACCPLSIPHIYRSEQPSDTMHPKVFRIRI
jgi:hypothetical protein